ncbi:MAG: ABC transporter permease [Acidiphilium sp.]
MNAGLFLIQLLTALGTASSLFLVAAGLTVIFGVTRVVNFAHGSLYMLGAYIGWTILRHLPNGPIWFALGCLATAAALGAIGVAIEMILLRRLYHAPELYQLLATFGIVLMAENIVQLVWGPNALTIPRPGWMRGAVPIAGQAFPLYNLVMLAVGPAVLLLLWLLFTRTRWGSLVRAATQDRDMVAALGVPQQLLFTAVFGLGSALAGLSGALSLPNIAATSQMGLTAVTDAFVIVVVGGLGSVPGAYLASLLIALLQTFGVILIPQYTLVAVFVVMAFVLVARPNGLMGRETAAPRGAGEVPVLMRGATLAVIALGAAALALAAIVPFVTNGYVLSVVQNAAIAMLFAASLHFIMGPGGMPSFGHAAWFGLGAYGAALAATSTDLPMGVALLIAIGVAAAVAALVGTFMVKLSGIYFAMLTFAFAEVVWALVEQSTGFTGGDNGILNIWPNGWFASAGGFYALTLLLCVGGVLVLRRLIFSPFGFSLRATRDSALRAASVGVPVQAVRYVAFTIAGAVAGLSGALFTYAKGSAFPTYISVSHSIDALVIVLLGGIQTVAAPVIGALAYTGLYDYLQSATDLWQLLLGLAIIVLVLAFPRGIAGTAQRWAERWRP